MKHFFYIVLLVLILMVVLVSAEIFVPEDGRSVVFAVQPNSGTLEYSANINFLPNFYFYHGDHLGSANWVTDMQGQPIQNCYR